MWTEMIAKNKMIINTNIPNLWVYYFHIWLTKFNVFMICVGLKKIKWLLYFRKYWGSKQKSKRKITFWDLLLSNVTRFLHLRSWLNTITLHISQDSTLEETKVNFDCISKTRKVDSVLANMLKI